MWTFKLNNFFFKVRSNKDDEERQVMRDNNVEPKTRWTSEDSDALVRAVNEVGLEDWVTVAGLLVGWTSAQCRYRWNYSAFYNCMCS
jgi:hypothetical protein